MMRALYPSTAIAICSIAFIACFASLDGYSGGADLPDAEPESGGGDDAATPCATFTCGTLCVPADDPAYGCSVERNCSPCPGPDNGTSTCASGKCAVACAAPFLDCNANVADGCEIDPRSDPANCGSCGHPCSGGTPYCVDGACAANCPFTLCGALCVDVQTSLANCGGCDKPCPQPANGNGTPSCNGGVCAFACATGYASCDKDAGNGCEIFVAGTDVMHCGSCNACQPPAHSNATCASGMCGSTCASGYVDCNGAANDGCECRTGNGVICRSDKTCAQCSAQGAPCGARGDCCDRNNECRNGVCTFDN